MSFDQTARGENLQAYEEKVARASEPLKTLGGGSVEFPCDSCKDGARIRVEVSAKARVVTAQCHNYRENWDAYPRKKGCGHPKIMIT